MVQKSIKKNKVWSRAVREIVQYLEVDNHKDSLLEEPEINERTQQVIKVVRRKEAIRNVETLDTVPLITSTPKNRGLREVACKIEQPGDKLKDKQHDHNNILDLEESSEEDSLQQGIRRRTAFIDMSGARSGLRKRMSGIASYSKSKVLEEGPAIQFIQQDRGASNETYRTGERDRKEEIIDLEPEHRTRYGRRADVQSSTDVDYRALPDYAPPASSLAGVRTMVLVHGIHTTSPLDLSNDPDRHLLYIPELELASVLRLSCATYVCSKRRIFRGRLNALRLGKDFRKIDA